MRFVVRKMRKKDLLFVTDLAMFANPHVNKKKYQKHVLAALEENPDLSMVAVAGGKVVGYAQAEVHDGEALLEDVSVAKKYRGKGLGSRLLTRELEALMGKGASSVFAEVHYKCAAAIPFYYQHGFRITGFVQDYFGMGHDAVILKLTLHDLK